MNFALLVCYIGYRLTPAVPPRQAAPPHPALRVRPARPACRGVARVSGGGRWALGESSLDSNDETWFLVSFWKTGCEADPVCPDRDTDALGHCAPRGSRRGLFPQGRGQTAGPGPGPQSWATSWAEAGLPVSGWKQQGGGLPTAPGGARPRAPAAPTRTRGQPGYEEQRADGVVTWRGGSEPGSGSGCGPHQEAPGTRDHPQLPASIPHCRGRRQVPPSASYGA